MSRPSLVNARLKLARAYEHIECLEEAGKRFKDKNTYRFDHHFNTYLRVYRIWIIPTEQPPPEFAVIAGDILYNCASALDHLVCDLARVGNPLTECRDNQQFPIFTSAKRYREKRDSYLRDVPPAARAIIQRAQPFMTQKWKEDPLVHVLELLRLLYNVDKHRRLNIVQSAVRRAVFRPSHPAIYLVGDPYVGPVEGRTELVTLGVPRIVHGEVRVDVDLDLVVAMDEGEGRFPWDERPTLSQGMRSIHYWIKEKILPQFERTFDPLP